MSLDKPIYDEESDRTLLDVISEAKVTDPEEMIISQEEYTDIESKISELLSDLESAFFISRWPFLSRDFGTVK